MSLVAIEKILANSLSMLFYFIPNHKFINIEANNNQQKFIQLYETHLYVKIGSTSVANSASFLKELNPRLSK